MGSSCNSCCKTKRQNIPFATTKDNVAVSSKIIEPNGFFGKKNIDNPPDEENSSGGWLRMTTMKMVAKAEQDPEEENKKEENSFDCEETKKNLWKKREDSGGFIGSTSRNSMSPKEEPGSMHVTENEHNNSEKQKLLKRTITPSFSNKKNKATINPKINDSEAIEPKEDENVSFQEEEKEKTNESEPQNNSPKVINIPKLDLPITQNEETCIKRKVSFTPSSKKEELCESFPIEPNTFRKTEVNQNLLAVPNIVQHSNLGFLPIKNQDTKSTTDSDNKKRIVIVENSKDKNKKSIFKNLLKKVPKSDVENQEIKKAEVVEKQKPESKYSAFLNAKFIEPQAPDAVTSSPKSILDNYKKKSQMFLNSPVVDANSFKQNESSCVENTMVIAKMDELGNKMVNQYMVLGSLGRGSYGVVKRCFDTILHKQVAMKVLNKKKLKRQFVTREKTSFHVIQNELAIMKKMNHPNIVQLYEIIDDPAYDKLFIIMEFIQGGTIDSMIKQDKKISMDKSWIYFRELISGLEYCHEVAGIIHRDIKPENLLVTSADKLKIVDFGVAFMMQDGSDESKSTQGSAYYLAPEICKGEIYKGKKTDIWAAGVTLYYMTIGKLPFEAPSIGLQYQNIINKEPTYPKDLDNDLLDLLKKLLEKNPHTRISIQEIKNHKWITKNGKCPVGDCVGKIAVTDEDKNKAIVTFRAAWTMARLKVVMARILKRVRKKLAM